MNGQQVRTLAVHLEPKRNTEGGQTSGGGDFAFDALFTYDALGRDDTEIILDK